jgi:serine/threonine-protein kinase
VYRAFDPQLQRMVALKILMRASPKARQRFAREVQAVARLRHPNVVSIHDSGEESGRPYLVMEFVDGLTFEDLIRAGRLPLRERVRLVRDVTRAIQYAHDQGVLHRDLKPENVLVDQDQEAQVLDFGLAYLEEESGLQRLSISGIPMGTPAYMAPEQAAGRRPDQRTDVWGLGGILYFALLGEGPFERFSNPLMAVQNEPVKRPREANPQVPAALDRVCMRCLAKVPSDRYASARELAEALTAWLERGDSFLQLPTGRAAQVATVAAGLLLTVSAGLIAFALARSRPATAVGTSPTPTGSHATPSPSSPASPAAPSPEPELSAQAQDVQRTLAKARELGAKLLDSELILAEIEQAAARAKGDRGLEEAVALARVGHHLRRAEFDLAETALETHPWRDPVAADRLRLELYVAMEDEERAKRILPKLTRGEPTHVGAILARGWLQLLDGADVDAALFSGRRALELAPKDVHALLFVAHVYLLRDDSRRAHEHLERAKELAPDDHRIYERLALTLQGDDAEAALRAYDELVLILGPRTPARIYAARGLARSQADDVEGSLDDLQRALRLDPTLFSANLSLGLYHLQRGDAEEARGHLLAAHEKNPTAFGAQLEAIPQSYAEQVRDLVGLEETPQPLPDDLLAWLEERAAAAEAPAQAPLRQALLSAARGAAWSEVSQLLERARAAAPESQAVALEQARLACRRDAYADTERALARARSLGAPAVELDTLQAELHGRRGEYAEAAAQFKLIAEAEGTETVWGLTAAASRALLEEDYETALSLAKESLKKDVRQPACRVIEILCLLRLGEARQARRHAEFAVTAYGLLDSRLPINHCRTWLHELSLRIQGGGEVARDDVLQIVDAFESLRGVSEGVSHLVSLLDFLLSHPTIPGATDHALRLLNEALEREPTRPQLHMQAAWLFSLLGDRDQVTLALERLRKLGVVALPPALRETYRRAFGDTEGLDTIFPPD